MKLLQRSTSRDAGAGDGAGQWEGIMAVEEASWSGEGQREGAYREREALAHQERRARKTREVSLSEMGKS